MIYKETILGRIRMALRQDPRIDLKSQSIKLDLLENNKLLLQGEVESISIKRLIMDKVQTLPEITSILDHLDIDPVEPQDDEMILKFACQAMIEETLLSNCSILSKSNEIRKTLRETSYKLRGEIEISVIQGVICLEKYVVSHLQKQLAGVISWWVPGTRNVINKLEIAPVPKESNYEICDTVRMILEKDPCLNASQIQIRAINSVVILEGRVETETQKKMAENDIWYIVGVNKVINHLIVQE